MHGESKAGQHSGSVAVGRQMLCAEAVQQRSSQGRMRARLRAGKCLPADRCRCHMLLHGSEGGILAALTLPA